MRERADYHGHAHTPPPSQLRAARDEAKLVRRQNEELRQVLQNMYAQQEFDKERTQVPLWESDLLEFETIHFKIFT